MVLSVVLGQLRPENPSVLILKASTRPRIRIELASYTEVNSGLSFGKLSIECNCILINFYWFWIAKNFKTRWVTGSVHTLFGTGYLF